MELNRIIHADCMDVLKDIPDKWFELAIVDPPYGIGMDGGKRQYSEYERKEWDVIPEDVYFKELFRISENQIIWGGNYFKLPPNKCFIIWDKTIHGNTYADGEYAWSSFNKPARIFPLNICFNRGRIHPTQKPIALYRWLLQNYAKPGDKIIDTHSGSGSCAIACHLEKFEFLAIEKDEDYYKSSVARFNEIKSQGVLF